MQSSAGCCTVLYSIALLLLCAAGCCFAVLQLCYESTSAPHCLLSSILRSVCQFKVFGFEPCFPACCMWCGLSYRIDVRQSLLRYCRCSYGLLPSCWCACCPRENRVIQGAITKRAAPINRRSFASWAPQLHLLGNCLLLLFCFSPGSGSGPHCILAKIYTKID